MNDEMTPEQKRWQEEHDKEQDQFYRKRNNILLFWRTCSNPGCRRARVCHGDSYDCFTRNWRPLPEGDKVFVRAALAALVEGRKPAEAAEIGGEALARFMAQGAGLSPAACIQADPSRVSS